MIKYYILEGKEPKEVNDVINWECLYESLDRIVNRTYIGDTLISTIFLGIDHSFGDGKPLLFETMILGNKNVQYQVRYSTWDEAIKGHIKACKLVLQ